ncbi:MAG: type II toxin-antitoxin system mRNA interferase toxin, RelE/StbE family [Candidatus Marinimicrobia bacterium]|nr:type II toxin-antitoxin system mRNA interferase toxin, RelE/StbE family [Candidatus Neomarinimicrobiota bacterium]
MYIIKTTPSFLRTAKKFFKRHPELRERFATIIELLRKNPTAPVLKIHALTGELKGLHAISLTYKYRITLIIRITEKTIILVDVGSHDEVYR